MKRLYETMKVVSVEENNDQPKWWGKYKVGYTYADGRSKNTYHKYTDVKRVVGDTFQEAVEF